MVDFHNPVTMAREFGAYALSSGSSRGFTFVIFNSGDCKSLAHRGWYIYVSFPAVPLLPGLYLTIQLRPPAASSWEFFTTLEYEWDVIRGHRPYRWTIGVCTLLSGFRQSSLAPPSHNNPFLL